MLTPQRRSIRAGAVQTGILVFALALLSCTPDVLLARSSQAPSIDGGGGGDGGGTTIGAAGNAGAPDGGADASGGAGGAPEPSGERLLADSIADFSLVQGDHGWLYGYDLGNIESFALLTRQTKVVAFQPPSGQVWEGWAREEPHWTQIFQLGAHPNGLITSSPSQAVLERAVRRWVSSYTGEIRIRGEVAKIDISPSSNGVDASVLVDGASLGSWSIGGTDGAGVSYEVLATVHASSTVDFVLDPHESNDHFDLSRFTAAIEVN